MDLRKFVVILFVILYFSVIATAENTEDIIYPLNNSLNISLSEIKSIQEYIVSEYNKDFERYPPENKQLYPLFLLNTSFKSIIEFSYYGGIGFLFTEGNTPVTVIEYFNKSEDFHFSNVISFGKNPHPNLNFVNVGINQVKFNYGFWTGISDMNPVYLKQKALNYYLLDYTSYLTANASFKKINSENSQKLINMGEEVVNVYRSNDDIKKVEVTVKYLQFADDIGISDDSARKLLDKLKNSTQINNSEFESLIQLKEQTNPQGFSRKYIIIQKPTVNESVLSPSSLSGFFNRFESYIIALFFLVLVGLSYFLNLRKVIKERHEIKNEIKNLFKPFYDRLNTAIKPRLLQIKLKIHRQKQEGKR